MFIYAILQSCNAKSSENIFCHDIKQEKVSGNLFKIEF